MMHKGYICILSVAHAVADLPPGALPALLPFFALYYHLSYTEIAGLMFASRRPCNRFSGYWPTGRTKTPSWQRGFCSPESVWR